MDQDNGKYLVKYHAKVPGDTTISIGFVEEGKPPEFIRGSPFSASFGEKTRSKANEMNGPSVSAYISKTLSDIEDFFSKTEQGLQVSLLILLLLLLPVSRGISFSLSIHVRSLLPYRHSASTFSHRKFELLPSLSSRVDVRSVSFLHSQHPPFLGGCTCVSMYLRSNLYSCTAPLLACIHIEVSILLSLCLPRKRTGFSPFAVVVRVCILR